MMGNMALEAWPAGTEFNHVKEMASSQEISSRKTKFSAEEL